MSRQLVKIGAARIPQGPRTEEDAKENVRFVIRTLFADQKYEFQLSDDPDYVIYFASLDACPPGKHPYDPQNDHIKIFVSWEPPTPDDLNQYDWLFTWVYDDLLGNPRHLRVPYHYYFGSQYRLSQPRDWDRVFSQKTKFCNFIYSRDVEVRNEFMRRLNRYKRVDSPGRCCRNMVMPLAHAGKSYKPIDFLRSYKFTISFENSSIVGYTTEKICESMYADSIPIYWGNPWIGRDFNADSFVHVYDKSALQHPRFGMDYQEPDYSISPSETLSESMDVVIERIIQLDNDDALYAGMLRQPWRAEYGIPDMQDRLSKRCREIFG